MGSRRIDGLPVQGAADESLEKTIHYGENRCDRLTSAISPQAGRQNLRDMRSGWVVKHQLVQRYTIDNPVPSDITFRR